MAILFLLFITISSTAACRSGGQWAPPPPKPPKVIVNQKIETTTEANKTQAEKYFSSDDSWGGWNPPADNVEWKEWIEKWGKDRTTDRPESEEWGSERGPNSGWPEHWKGDSDVYQMGRMPGYVKNDYGQGIAGVPPPPWAYIPESYDKPQYCFEMPQFGHCSDKVTRWGFNPSKGQCQTFLYSGCGGNGNNFMNEAHCKTACVDTAAVDCVVDPEVNFDDMISHDFNVQPM